MSRPFPPRPSTPGHQQFRVNGKIRAREVRVIGQDSQQLGIMDLGAAIRLAQTAGVDLVEIAPTAQPPVCRLVDYGKFKYEQSKKDRDSKKHQHANKVKEVQLSAQIDPHDFSIKRDHAIDFMCEDMKVKVSLRFRGREMAHTEFGFEKVNRFIEQLAPWGHPDNQPKLVGRSINVMLTPHPRNKRAKHPKAAAGEPDHAPGSGQGHSPAPGGKSHSSQPSAPSPAASPAAPPQNPPAATGGFTNNPFEQLDRRTESPG